MLEGCLDQSLDQIAAQGASPLPEIRTSQLPNPPTTTGTDSQGEIMQGGGVVQATPAYVFS
jgi:hypothetical protein